MAEPIRGPRKDLFGDIAVELRFLAWAQVRDVLKQQAKYKSMGIPMRIGEVAVELGLLTQPQCNEILAAQSERRKSTKVDKPKTNEIQDWDEEGGEHYQLGQYNLEKRLGGVMGIVYKGVDQKTGRVIALKVLPKQIARDLSFVERFKREVRATSTLSHPNIIAILDSGVLNDLFFLVMEYVDGESVAQRLRRERVIKEADSLRIARDVAGALAHAHENNILHRDVKPDNIMIAKDGTVKLADLGLAKFLEDEQGITAEGIAVGTPHYIAPEQARALKNIDARADIYSLGASLFHIVTGRLPFEGDDGGEVMRRHVFDPIPDPREMHPELSDATAAAIMKMMAKNPAQRFQSAKEVEHCLDQILDEHT